MDYLLYRWTNHGITFIYHPHQYRLAQYEIFRAKVCFFCGKDGVRFGYRPELLAVEKKP